MCRSFITAVSVVICSFVGSVAEAALATPSLAFCKRLNQVAVRLKRTETDRAQARVARNRAMQERANRSLNSGCGAKRVKSAVLPSTREYCASPQPVYRPIIKGQPLH